jgi:hypothetical protein
MIRLNALVALSIALTAMTATPSFAQDTVETLFAKARGLNPTLKDQTSDISISLDASLGPIPVHRSMSGQYYYKRPDRHKLDVQNAPSALKKFGNVFGFRLPALEKYNAKVIGEYEIGGRKVKKIQMTPKVKVSDIERLELYIDPERGTVPKFDTFYTKGFAYIDIDFTQSNGYWVFDHMKADLSLSGVAAKAKADYSNYKFNLDLKDGFFSWMRGVYELARLS